MDVSPRTRVVHVLRDAAFVEQAKREGRFVAVHRPGPWGNPFSHKEGTLAAYRVGTIAEAIEQHKRWLLNQPELLAKLHELHGKVLGCFCSSPSKPKPCHAHTLAALADATETPDSDQLSLF